MSMPFKTMLVVDDEETDREQIRDILHSQDYMVLEAGAYYRRTCEFLKETEMLSISLRIPSDADQRSEVMAIAIPN